MTTISIPSIWIPRPRKAAVEMCPRCRKRKLGYFEKKWADLTHKMPINACCCVSCTAPTAIVATMSNITNCDCAVAFFGPSLIFGSLSAFENVAYSLPFSSAAQTRLTFVNSITFSSYAAFSNCTSPLASGNATISLSYVDASPSQFLSYIEDWTGTFFQQSFTRLTSYSNLTVSNSQTVCPGHDNGPLGISGAVSLQFFCTLVSLASVGSSNFTNTGGSGNLTITLTDPSKGTQWFAWNCGNNLTRARLGTGVDGSNDSFDWLQFTSATSGTGNGTLSYSVAANATGSARSCFISVCNDFITVNQSA